MKMHSLSLLISVSLFASTLSADWQSRRLMQPTEKELTREDSGQIVIYDGMAVDQVNVAMNWHFDRIENMMFVRTRVPVESGEEDVIDDGCD